MPFGVRGGPSSFQRMMNKVLKGLKNVLIFMDDVLIFSDTIEANIELFNEAMRRLREVNLLVQIEKCELLKSEVCYLGFIVNKDEVKPNPEKIRVVKEFPRPKNVKNILQLIGLCSFYRKHIKNFAKVSKPLTKLVDKNNKFQWNDEADTAFETLKKLLTSAPILKHPNWDLPFIIHSDASLWAVGGALLQKINNIEYPIAYTSRVLTPVERRYSTYEREMLGILHCIEQFKPYIYNTHFVLYTDHKPLTYSGKIENNRRVLKWKHRLSDMDYEILYKPGKQNFLADCLSRIPETTVEHKEIKVVTRAQKKNLENMSLNNDENNVQNQEHSLSNKRSIFKRKNKSKDVQDSEITNSDAISDNFNNKKNRKKSRTIRYEKIIK